MLPLRFANKLHTPLQVLCLGSHPDDIEIGCGGTVLRILDEHDGVCVHWVVLSGNAERRVEAETSANRFLAKASRKNIILKDFRESFFPYTAVEIKEYFESLKHEFRPDLVFTHYRQDLHQDHRVISELTWNTFRDHLILEYEIPKYDGDMAAPNIFVLLEERTSRQKIDHILDVFPSQRHHKWFSQDTFLSILRLRAIECNSPSKYAEAFYCRKLLLTISESQ